jgi:hypothetical protein
MRNLIVNYIWSSHFPNYSDDGSHSFHCNSGSRRSYTGTSITSAVDLSLLSFNNSLTNSNHEDDQDGPANQSYNDAIENNNSNCDNVSLDEKDNFEIIERLVIDLEQSPAQAMDGIIRENMRQITLN